MQPEKMDDLREDIADKLRQRLDTLREHAEHFAHQQVEEMIDKGQAIELTDDEERMLKAYRAFRTRHSYGTFSWDMPEEAGLITELPEPVLIRDPRDVSSTHLMGRDNDERFIQTHR